MKITQKKRLPVSPAKEIRPESPGRPSCSTTLSHKPFIQLACQPQSSRWDRNALRPPGVNSEGEVGRGREYWLGSASSWKSWSLLSLHLDLIKQAFGEEDTTVLSASAQADCSPHLCLSSADSTSAALLSPGNRLHHGIYATCRRSHNNWKKMNKFSSIWLQSPWYLLWPRLHL